MNKKGLFGCSYFAAAGFSGIFFIFFQAMASPMRPRRSVITPRTRAAVATNAIPAIITRPMMIIQIQVIPKIHFDIHILLS